ncbi:MAG: SpoIIIAH-like family protein [Clostridia bacterium]|nr:SpoIIIAH-like family protein [Clostridia bacterium]
MRHPKEHIWMTLLLLTAVLSAFYLRGQTARPVSVIPVQRVFVAVSPTPLPAGFHQQREAQRREEVAALTALASQDSQAAERLRRLLETAEAERAVEDTLLSMGYGNTVCVLRNEGATVCLGGALTAEQAQAVAGICAHLTGISADRVFLLDECAYL